MIEIMKHGNKKFDIVCETCGCHFSYTLEDIHIHKGPIDCNKYVKCPECDNECCHPKQTNFLAGFDMRASYMNTAQSSRILNEQVEICIGSNTCVVCGKPIPEGGHICNQCAAKEYTKKEKKKD